LTVAIIITIIMITLILHVALRVMYTKSSIHRLEMVLMPTTTNTSVIILSN